MHNCCFFFTSVGYSCAFAMFIRCFTLRTAVSCWEDGNGPVTQIDSLWVAEHPGKFKFSLADRHTTNNATDIALTLTRDE